MREDFIIYTVYIHQYHYGIEDMLTRGRGNWKVVHIMLYGLVSLIDPEMVILIL